MKVNTRIKAAAKLREVEGALEEAVREAAKNRDLKAVLDGARPSRKAVGK